MYMDGLEQEPSLNINLQQARRHKLFWEAAGLVMNLTIVGTGVEMVVTNNAKYLVGGLAALGGTLIADYKAKEAKTIIKGLPS